MFKMFRRLDARTAGRLASIRLRARGLARHGERETQVNIPTGAGYANACDYCARKLRAAQDREDARESAGDDAYDRMKDERGTARS